MNPSDVGPEAADHLLDALAGLPTAGGPADASLDAVAALLAAAAADLDEPVEPSPQLLAAMVGAAPAIAPAAPRRLRKVVPIAAVAAGLLVGTSAAAATGTLPDVLQDVAHDVAGVVGVHVPTAAEAHHGDPAEGPDGASNSTSAGHGVGQDGTPPGQGGTVPGTGADGGGNGVGPDGTPPGQGGTVPGTGADGGGNGVGPDGTPPSTTPTTTGNGGGAGGNGGGNPDANASGRDRTTATTETDDAEG